MSSDAESSSQSNGLGDISHGVGPSLGQTRITRYLDSYGGRRLGVQSKISRFFKKMTHQPLTSTASAPATSWGRSGGYKHPSYISVPPTPFLGPSLAVSDPDLLRPSSIPDLNDPASAVKRSLIPTERCACTFTKESSAGRGSIAIKRPLRDKERPTMPLSSGDDRDRFATKRYPPDFREQMASEATQRHALMRPCAGSRKPYNGSRLAFLGLRSQAHKKAEAQRHAGMESSRGTKRSYNSGSDSDVPSNPRLHRKRQAVSGAEAELPQPTWRAGSTMRASRASVRTAPTEPLGCDTLDSLLTAAYELMKATQRVEGESLTEAGLRVETPAARRTATRAATASIKPETAWRDSRSGASKG